MKTIALLCLLAAMEGALLNPVTQWTFSPRGHDLDNNDNFSPDGRLVLFDTRETVGPEIQNNQAIAILDTQTQQELTLYAVTEYVTGEGASPGVGAASFSPDGRSAIFIHGPLLPEVPERGPYTKPNRRGALVRREEPGKVYWLDWRDVATDRDTTPGAHRGGTHRHEYSRDGSRIGFTYDDVLLPQYERTIGYMEPREDAPGDASHYFAVILKPALAAEAQPGDIVRAWGDSWVNAEGTLRGFIGKVKEPDGSFQQSLFVAEIPKGVDITTADAGGPDRYPAPPQGITIRRLTTDWAEGVVRGAPSGDRVAYYGKDDKGLQQIFVVAVDGASPPRQVTSLPKEVVGIEGGLRWHPDGNYLVGLSDGDVFSVSLREENFGETRFLTADGLYKKLAITPDGTTLFFIGPDPRAAEDPAFRNYAGVPFMQIFSVPYSAP